jgi:hypothetical protein
MLAILVEYDTEVRAFYVRVIEEETARTVEVSVLVSVYVDAADNVVGLELLYSPGEVTPDERARFTPVTRWLSPRWRMRG